MLKGGYAPSLQDACVHLGAHLAASEKEITSYLYDVWARAQSNTSCFEIWCTTVKYVPLHSQCKVL